MTDQSNMTVIELAKELGVPALPLVDKLKEINIKVKSHMSELSADEVQRARTELGKKEAPAAKKATTRKTTTKKAAPTSGESAPAGATAAAKPTAVMKKSTSVSAEKAAAKAAPATVPAATASAAAATAAAPIIRRRVKDTGETEVVGRPPSAEEIVAKEEAVAGGYEYIEGEAAAQAEAEAEAAELAAVDETEAQEQEMLAEDQDSASAAGLTHAANGDDSAAASSLSAGAAPASRPAIVLPPRPVAPRKSFLKIVEAKAPPPRPMVKPAAPSPVQPRTKPVPGAPGEARPIGFRVMTKENLDQMVEEEAAKKRGGGARVPEIRPEDVRFADYRKKEMVFLPKKKRLPVGKQLAKTQITETRAAKRVVEMQNTIQVSDLANQLSVKGTDVVRKLMGMGVMASLNQSVDFDTATLIATEYKYEVRNVAFKEAELIAKTVDKDEDMKGRPPVVTIMGHVDHGKTSLLDAIREANVAGGEAGGITQHIGAYTVEKDGKLITFIDTPGHEAFTVMRARGANVTDIVILVVAADDGVMPQTREALSHAKAANVPIIVAMNKMDKPGANPEKIKQQLAELDLLAEDWGGQTMFVPVSAIKKTNLDKLLESILLQAEVADLKGNAEARASGTVLEARLEKGRGPVVSVLVRRGTLRVGDAVVSGKFAGKVKAIVDHKGDIVTEVGPGRAGEVLGFEGVPNAGEPFDSPATEADARDIATHRIDQARAPSEARGKASLDDLFSKISAGNVKELNVILKADVFGSVEAIRDSLVKQSTDKVKVKVIHSATGGITESDVLLAGASGAIIIGFNVRPETKARQVAEAEHVEIKNYTIIYELLDDIKNSMVGLLDKKKVEKFLGRAEVRQTFNVPKIGTIAGSSVIDGKIVRGANVRLLRESRIIYEGKMSSLKRFKDDAKEVASGFECGIGLENYNDLKAGDLIEAYTIEMVTPDLNA